MNETLKPKSLLDGFQGFEAVDSPANRLIQGQIVKFTNQATWITRDGEELSGTLELVAVNVIRVVQKWDDGQPIETRVLQPGEKFPDVEKLNASVPQSEWRQGPDGKLHGPWQAQYLLYLLNPNTVERYTYATGHHRRRHRRSRSGRSRQLDAKPSRRERLRRGHPAQHVHEDTVRRAPTAASAASRSAATAHSRRSRR